MRIDSLCPKCENPTPHKVEYVAPNNDLLWGGKEHLFVTCQRCGYGWRAPTKDVPKPQKMRGVTLRKVQDDASDYDVYYGKKYLGFIYKSGNAVEVEHPKTGMTWDIDEKWNTKGILAGVAFLLSEAEIEL